MYIVSGDALQIIDSACVERFVVAKKPDAVLILASYGAERQPITIAKYESSRRLGMPYRPSWLLLWAARRISICRRAGCLQRSTSSTIPG